MKKRFRMKPMLPNEIVVISKLSTCACMFNFDYNCFIEDLSFDNMENYLIFNQFHFILVEFSFVEEILNHQINRFSRCPLQICYLP